MATHVCLPPTSPSPPLSSLNMSQVSAVRSLFITPCRFLCERGRSCSRFILACRSSSDGLTGAGSWDPTPHTRPVLVGRATDTPSTSTSLPGFRAEVVDMWVGVVRRERLERLTDIIHPPVTPPAHVRETNVVFLTNHHHRCEKGFFGLRRLHLVLLGLFIEFSHNQLIFFGDQSRDDGPPNVPKLKPDVLNTTPCVVAEAEKGMWWLSCRRRQERRSELVLGYCT
ncbi:hypothetical protein P167DRAFT_545604 [Morchella conica CCBAS932]|uniref:Uncharacterized protein n=1 Tax=Morchella conica CCBAS932 TaxID=1392247 RepID=A0A3N4L300_9PEZI|nr:hypothetical protein P167DRAFT_545604 [Morchella conica CCBAS932]